MPKMRSPVPRRQTSNSKATKIDRSKTMYYRDRAFYCPEASVLKIVSLKRMRYSEYITLKIFIQMKNDINL